MKHFLETADKDEGYIERTPEQCSKIIVNTATKLKVLPEQLRSCARDSMQKRARKLASVVWPDPISRAKVNAKTVDRQLLKLIHGE